MNNFLLKLDSKTIRNLGVMLVAGLTVLGILVSATPIINSINARNIETAKLNNEYTQLSGKIQEYSAMKGQNDQLDATSQFLMNKFPEASDVPGLLTSINKVAGEVGLNVNLVNNITVGVPTQVVEPLGITGDAVCGSLTPGEFAKIIPDLKNSTAEEKVYVMCSEKPIKELGRSAIYNAATENPARQCKFTPDAGSGTLFYITVSCEPGGNILPALRAGSINIDGEVGKFPARNILAQVTGQVAQMSVTISLDNTVDVNVLSKFISGLYGMDRAISITSIKVGMTNDRNGVAYTVISGYVYSHTAIITGDGVGDAEEVISTDGDN